jgi:hypothetical protein
MRADRAGNQPGPRMSRTSGRCGMARWRLSRDTLRISPSTLEVSPDTATLDIRRWAVPPNVPRHEADVAAAPPRAKSPDIRARSRRMTWGVPWGEGWRLCQVVRSKVAFSVRAVTCNYVRTRAGLTWHVRTRGVTCCYVPLRADTCGVYVARARHVRLRADICRMIYGDMCSQMNQMGAECDFFRRSIFATNNAVTNTTGGYTSLGK